MTRVLLMASDSAIARTVQMACEGHNISVLVAPDAREGLVAIRDSHIEAVIIDLSTSAATGLKALRTIRRVTRELPVIVTNGGAVEMERRRALDDGADAYLSRDQSLSELTDCVQRLTNPATGGDPGTNERIRIGAIVIDLRARTVRRGLHRVHLRPMEYQLLLALVRHRGVPLSRSDLLREVWLREPDGRGRTVDTHIASLRQKLGWDARASHRIVTVFNEGYMLTAD